MTVTAVAAAEDGHLELGAALGVIRADHDALMRTTLTIEDHLARALKERAHRTGKPFKQVVNEMLRAGLSATRARRSKPYG